MNCFSDSAPGQYMEVHNEQKLLVLNYRRRIWLSRKIFVQNERPSFNITVSPAHAIAGRGGSLSPITP